MRKLLFVLVLLFAAPLAHAQKFISSSGGVLAVDCLTGTTSFKTTVFEAITSVSIVNAVPGETISIIFQQDATGHSVTFGGNVAGTPSVSSTANAVTVITLNYDSRANTWNQENSGGGTAINPLGTAGAFPQFAFYTFYMNSGTVYARNNSTGAIDASGTDLRAVWDAIATPLASVGGMFLFNLGSYPCTTLDTESTGGFSNRYCVGIPSGGSSQYAQWILQGTGAPPIIDQFSSPVQTNGVIFNVTSTALATVTATTKVMGIWARPDVTNSIGASVFVKNIDIRVPDNQRGCETESDLSQALSSYYLNVIADTAVAQNSLAFPVEASCTAWGATDPGGLIGLTTTNGSKEQNDMRRSFAIGADVGLDIRGEHSILENSYGLDGNHCIDYGVRGGNIFHLSSWISSGWGECARGLTIGSDVQAGALLDISGLDMEDASSGVFVPVYHADEVNPGNTYGRISYTHVLQGTGITALSNLFDGGGGTHIDADNPNSRSQIYVNDTGASSTISPVVIVSSEITGRMNAQFKDATSTSYTGINFVDETLNGTLVGIGGTGTGTGAFGAKTFFIGGPSVSGYGLSFSTRGGATGNETHYCNSATVPCFTLTGAGVGLFSNNFGAGTSKGQHLVTFAAASDISGTCTFASTTCTVTFTTAYTSAPVCTANDQTAAAPVKSAPATGSVVFTGGTGAGATDVVGYHCWGNPN